MKIELDTEKVTLEEAEIIFNILMKKFIVNIDETKCTNCFSMHTTKQLYLT